MSRVIFSKRYGYRSFRPGRSIYASGPGYLAPYLRQRNIIFEVSLFGLWLKERGILHLKRVCFAFWLIE